MKKNKIPEKRKSENSSLNEFEFLYVRCLIKCFKRGGWMGSE